MTLEIILLLMSIALMIILWAGFNGVEVSGPLAVGLVSVAIGVLGLCNFHEFDARFGVSMGFLVVGGAVFFSAMRKNESWKEFAAALCVAGALVCGVYAILSL
ncbi:MAG: hypothetical protein WC455_06215 [Dehalococcoidia bacterium]|jgi:uncharacterized membrane protein